MSAEKDGNVRALLAGDASECRSGIAIPRLPTPLARRCPTMRDLVEGLDTRRARHRRVSPLPALQTLSFLEFRIGFLQHALPENHVEEIPAVVDRAFRVLDDQRGRRRTARRAASTIGHNTDDDFAA